MSDAPIIALQQRLRPLGDGEGRTVVVLPSIDVDGGLLRRHAAELPALEERARGPAGADRRARPRPGAGVHRALQRRNARARPGAGAVGVIVSNQGGRQLDGDPATLDVLPEVVDAVGERVDVLVDGGIRDGSDVLKALALGAGAVLIGRPVYWSLSAGGEAGVRKMLEILRDGLENAMQTAGVASVADIGRDLVRRAA